MRVLEDRRCVVDADTASYEVVEQLIGKQLPKNFAILQETGILCEAEIASIQVAVHEIRHD